MPNLLKSAPHRNRPPQRRLAETPLGAALDAISEGAFMTARSSALTAPSTTDWREWWADESVRTGSNWRSLFELHCQIVDRLRASSSWAS